MKSTFILLVFIFISLGVRVSHAFDQLVSIEALLEASPFMFHEDLTTKGAVLASSGAGSLKALTGAQNPLLSSIRLATGIFTIQKCGQLEMHVHTNTFEYNYVMQGNGSFSLWSSNGSVVLEKVTVAPGTVMVIPPGWPHMISGPENFVTPLVFVGTFTSGAPQTYFLAGINTVFNAAPSYIMASEFNETQTNYRAFFGAEKGGGFVFNETCLGIRS